MVSLLNDNLWPYIFSYFNAYIFPSFSVLYFFLPVRYDNEYRYLKAGAFEMVIRRFVDSHELRRLGINQINGNGGNKEKEEEERWDTKVKVPPRDVATQIHEAGEVGSGLGTFSKWSLSQGDQDEADRNREVNEYTKCSKHHFYGAVNFLRRFEEECSADDTPQGTTSRLTFYGFAACVASFLRSGLSLNQKSIFDKWSPKYLEGMQLLFKYL